MNQSITCPNCNQQIELTQALKHQFEEEAKKEYQKDMEAQILKARREESEKAKKEQAEEFKLLSEQLEEQKKKADEARKIELDLRRDRVKFDNEKKEFELNSQRKLDEERQKISEEATRKSNEAHQLKDLEMNKKLQDVLKANEEMKRKLEQGSQQTQGEVLELHIEELLKNNFVYDEVAEVPKGVRGADILQKVKTQRGTHCGTIIWELKRTKAWSEGWVSKLKEDQRAVVAEQAVLVTEVLPKGIRHFDYYQGIWVCDFESIKSVAVMLRHALIQITGTKLAGVGKNEKMEAVYEYLTGTVFRQRVESILETCKIMKDDLEQEKKAFTARWSKRDKHIESLLGSTIRTHGDLQGFMGKSLPEIKHLELSSGEEGELS